MTTITRSLATGQLIRSIAPAPDAPAPLAHVVRLAEKAGYTIHEYDTTDRNGQHLHITQLTAPTPWDSYIYETTTN